MIDDVGASARRRRRAAPPRGRRRARSRKAASCSARSTSASSSRARGRQLLCRLDPARAAPEAGAQQLGEALFVVCRHRDHLSTRRGTGVFLPSRLLERPEPREAAGDPARDRAGRDVERLADRAVALVAGEEAVEDLAALRSESRSRPRAPSSPRRARSITSSAAGSSTSSTGTIAAGRAEAVEAAVPRQLRRSTAGSRRRSGGSRAARRRARTRPGRRPRRRARAAVNAWVAIAET